MVWVSDITYVRTSGSGFAYLNLITDAYSRKIVGYYLSRDLRAEGTIKALRMALHQLDPDTEYSTTHHSDRGIQYCCHAYIDLLSKHGIQVSMTQYYDPYENALAERINRTIKEEFLQYYQFANYTEAVRAVDCMVLK